MRIQHNLPAINSRKNIKTNNSELKKNLERLSSGYRINRAGDDAAGLAISESFRALITGTEQAERNVQDGISLVQTAEGAMTEIHAMLQRAMTLGETAANGTYDQVSRDAIQQEFEELRQEIERITEHTNFNGIPLLLGKAEDPSGIEDVQVSNTSLLPAWVGQGAAMGAGQLTEIYQTTQNYEDPSGNSGTATINHAAGTLDFSAFADDPQNKTDLIDKGFFTTCFTCSRHYSIRFTNDTMNSVENSGSHMIFNIGIANVSTGEDLVKAILTGTDNGYPNGHYTKLVADQNAPAKLIIYDDRSMDPEPVPGSKWQGWDNPEFNINATQLPEYGKMGSGVAISVNANDDKEDIGDLQLQVGPSAKDVLQVHLPDLSSWAMGLGGLSMASQKSANHSMSRLSSTIDYLSGERGRMGSYQNRLEHTQRSLAVSHENLQAAESQIRDTDLAQEVTLFTKNRILQQAALSILSQANASPQMVLDLLS